MKLEGGSTRLDHIGKLIAHGQVVADVRLGVHGPGSDIDTICVCPRHIYKEHFFGEFQQMLREWPAVTEISVRSPNKVREELMSRRSNRLSCLL
jgi:poly(A) polymerase Pap1